MNRPFDRAYFSIWWGKKLKPRPRLSSENWLKNAIDNLLIERSVVFHRKPKDDVKWLIYYESCLYGKPGKHDILLLKYPASDFRVKQQHNLLPLILKNCELLLLTKENEICGKHIFGCCECFFTTNSALAMYYHTCTATSIGMYFGELESDNKTFI